MRIAAELAVSIEPPSAWSTRQPISHIAPPVAAERVEGEQDRGEGEDREAGVVDAHAAVHVAQPAEGDHQHRLDEPVAHDHPQQVADVARGQRVEVDAAEDRRQRDDHDRAVERRHEHGHRRVGERDPLVAVVGGLHQMLWARRSSSGATAASWSRSAGAELGGERPGELLDLGVAAVAQELEPGVGDRHHRAAPVVGVGRALDQAASPPGRASVAPIDCGLICSRLASAPGVVGPPRSRRARAEVSDSVSSPSTGI